MTDPDVAVNHVPLVRAVRPASDVRALRELKRLIRAWKPRIVHTHQAKAGAVGRLAAGRGSSRPITIHTFHGHVLEGYFGRAARAVFLAAERGLARRTDVLVAVSDEVRDELLELGIGERHQWRVIPLGFDLTRLLEIKGMDGRLRVRLALRDDQPIVGVLGRLAPIKDHVVLLDALREIPEAHLAIFGDGEMRDELRRHVRESGMTERIHFMGWWEDVAAAIAGVDVVALTSLNEGTPVSLIEASAAGLPVVATDVGGVRAVVEDGVTGYVVPARSPSAIAAALRDLLADPSKRAAMGAAGRKSVATRFSQDRLLADIRALYDELLASA